MSKWKDFNFDLTAIPADSDWARCITSFLNKVHRKCGSLHTQEHFCTALQRFYGAEPRRLPQFYNREDVSKFINAPGTAKGREGHLVKPQTINNRLSIINCLYKYAATYGVQGEDGMMYPLFPYLNPAAGVGYAKYSRSVSTKALTDDELRRFFAAIGNEGIRAKRDRALFLMYFWCARRRSEIVDLRWRDIETTLIVDGEGSRMATIYHFRGKGRKQIDDIAELPPIAAAALFAYLEERGILNTIEPDDYLFTALPDYTGRGGGYDPKRPLVDTHVWWIAQEYTKKAELTRKIGIHTFRHTAARARYANGASLLEIKTLLRHKNLSTTSIYLDQLVTTADPTAALLNAKFANL